MNVVDIVGEKTAEMTLPNACLTCGGAVQLRVSPDGVRTYCATCHTISKATLGVQEGGLVVAQDVKARA